jgi:hypothetical protein
MGHVAEVHGSVEHDVGEGVAGRVESGLCMLRLVTL